ncbi:MAG: Peptidoglycan glycosyltransferase [Candidatus Collierbacteria bacterium GW2011_GWB1_44_6]|uniref:Peptidoglycan glycosyltransferase n=2 Tax=Candidatus Collieribacteriota TaxID=1752725 RepID=A0A0G1JQK0_9BACT|nr:MAG: Peptidoglycan glycosyltransferase [Candidatus Collierbacteria bacterium GW2011_GWC2_43_12]KKT73811.1 MAG: Peptidoglycan glycosyltransferase [Candidatus Collierbacteria bacterium GW2011_GWB1_44_6]KKT84070.1 MAG: Peptidoglycan glycosyltransferase [Microgenomates group bacterium GW2011_GWC1_44_9]
MLKTQGTTSNRLQVITFLIPIIFLILVGRLFYWMVIRGPELQTKANRQHQTVTILKAKRGNILDSEGGVLAGTKNLYHLFVYKPQLTISNNDLVEKLVTHLAFDQEASTEAELRDHLQNRLALDSNWVSLKHYLIPEEKEKVESEKIPGIGFEDEYVRFYPDASMAGQILGFVGQDAAGQEQGYFGLEGYFDRLLKGREGRIRTENDAQGNPILIGNYQFLHSIEGKSLKTTIDKRMQYLSEAMLKEGLEKYQASAGTIIIMETATGKIRAMVSNPNYDPGKFSEFDNKVYKNPAVADLFEPGSVFKPLVMAAGLNENLITPETQCDICSGPINIGKYTIKTWDEKYHASTTMTDVIVHSDNTGMVFVARKLGPEKFAEYIKNYGFGKKTKIQLQEEVSGVGREANNYGDIDLATNSFGQGIAVTPVQLIAALNTIANNGVYISPTLVEGEPSPETRSVLRPETVSKMTQIMIQAVESGEAKWARPKGLTVAGKTGTAQIPIEGHYDPEKTIASFIGFFPAYRPQYTMLVSLREPQTSPWGSETAAPLWFALAKQLLL